MEKETRFSTIAKRDGEGETKMVVEGYAIVFDEETLIGDEERGFIEVIDKNALTNTNVKDVPFKIYKCIEAGLLDKMSFAFTVKSQSWDKSGKLPKRTITAIDRLFDVSVVDLPAYDQTSIQASSRSLEIAEAELKALDDAENLERRTILAKRIKLKTKF